MKPHTITLVPNPTKKKVYIGNLHSAQDWYRARDIAALHGNVKHVSRRTETTYAFIQMDTHAQALAVIKAIGSSRYNVIFDCDYETARVIRVPRVYAYWAR